MITENKYKEPYLQTILNKRMERFPEPINQNMSIQTFSEKFKNTLWTLHNLNRRDDTWPKDYYEKVIVSVLQNTLNSTFVVSMKGHLGALLDGGHRTSAILRFQNDEFEITIRDKKYKFSDLDITTLTQFKDSNLNIVKYSNLSREQEERLFFQCNVSLPLSPGECINAYHTIPMCQLAKELGEKYSSYLKETFNRAILNIDMRCDSSNIMMSLLENIYHKKIRISEKLTDKKQEDNKKRCEYFRNKSINKEILIKDITQLFESIPKHPTGKKMPCYVLHTVQHILITAPTVNTLDIKKWLSDELIKNSDEWKQLSRDNLSNPGTPQVCIKRAEIFIKKYIQKQN